MIVAAYLVAIVAANLSIAYFGPSIAVLNAFLFIGLDLTARDRLHDAWEGQDLALRMGLLITTGGVISYVLNRDAAQIAVASTVAFVVASLLDWLVYTLLGDRSRMLRVNGSNVVSAGADSLIFPWLAGFGFALVVPLFVAKVAGGLFWSLVLAVPVRRRAA